MNWPVVHKNDIMATIILPNLYQIFLRALVYIFYSYNRIIIYIYKYIPPKDSFKLYLYGESKKCHTMKVMWWLFGESFLLIKNIFLLVICRKKEKENVCMYNINEKTMNSSPPKHASMAKIDVYAYTISNRHTNANHTPQPHLDEEKKIQI